MINHMIQTMTDIKMEDVSVQDGSGDKSNIVQKVADQNNDSSPEFQTSFQSYQRRWFILSVVVIINFTNALIWIMFSPVTDVTAKCYDISFMKVNWLSLVYLIASVPSGFFASWMLDTMGLRASIICAGWLNLIGSVLRNITVYSFVGDDYKFPILITGQTVAACGQTFIMFTPAKLAALWFRDDQRAIATTVGSMSNPLGILMANVLSPALIKSPDDMGSMLWVCTGCSAVGALLATVGIHSSLPPTPPSPSAAAKSEPFFEGIKKLKGNKHYWYLTFGMGGGLALFTCFTTYMEQMLCPHNYSNDFAGLCGALIIALGIVGALIAGIVADKTKKFAEIAKIGFCLSNLFGIGFVQVARYRDQQALVAILASLFGGFGFTVWPICMELAVEITYPVAEATSTGLIFLSGQIQGVILMLACQYSAQPLSDHDASLPVACPKDGEFEPQDWTYPNLGGNLVGTIYCFVLVLLFKPQYRRMIVENMMKANSKEPPQAENAYENPGYAASVSDVERVSKNSP